MSAGVPVEWLRWEGESPAANRRFCRCSSIGVDIHRDNCSVLQYNAAWKLVLAGALKGGGRRSGESSMRSSPPMGGLARRRWNCCRRRMGAGFNTVEGWISGGGEGSRSPPPWQTILLLEYELGLRERFGLGGLGPEEIHDDQESDAHQTKGAQGLKDRQ